MKPKRHAEIAGAGFAGLTAAIALCQRGWTARIHETSRDLRAFGAGIFIWENGLWVLKSLGAYDRVMDGAHEAPWNESRNNKNERLYALKFGPGMGTRMLTMTRQHLFQALLAEAEKWNIEIVTNSEVTGAEPDGRLLTARGQSYRADLVVGADGVKSAVRDSLGLLSERTQFEQGVIRLLVARGQDDLTPEDRDNVINFWSPRFRVLYVPCNETELYILLGAHKDDGEGTALPVRKALYIEAFPFLGNILARIGDQGRFDVYETTKLKRWSEGRVAVIGDAAHAMPPTLGQGAGCAMMNALSLAATLERDGDVPAALAQWEASERPLTEHTQDVSGDHARGRVGSDPRRHKWDDAALRTALHIPVGLTRASSPVRG
jgi:2-methyl-3-hydroxypyridine 5-carboxylic acid dioxygenase